MSFIEGFHSIAICSIKIDQLTVYSQVSATHALSHTDSF